MAENTTEVAVGGIVLAAAMGFAIYATQLAGVSGPSDSYPLTASFRSIEGVSVGTDVRLAGVKVGTVTDVTLNTQTFRADATVNVQQSVEIPDDSAIVVASEGLLGGNFIEIVPGGSPFNFEEGAEITDTQGAVSLISLLLKFVSGGDAE
ncbi:putative phospholipid ABC transporter-binding protein MlaD [Ascidiaceihabitans donghaensis]|uniref:Putative phospholipid ABC transporter-binding protein MlaD n=1 Tax=Ascidiaceihabitans donghaensis TaxID=1510460 RepID=A0A2R8BFZ5_9RHOB|nr:outer membrane lipid asymmetry maintenance protein MlaD [Ascidiaceihabitans donghaensis]SPH21981.1 putative phospholipid ABC transporter-binding protein MlaD [Ascidiaceihabitans donghaensis]